MGAPQQWQQALAHRVATNEQEIIAIQHLIAYGWTEILRVAALRRRGACFVVLPTDAVNPDEVKGVYEIELKFPTNGPNIATMIANFAGACDTEGLHDVPAVLSKANQWQDARTMLLNAAKALSYASAVDGCTVFNQDLCLIGFGGKIKVAVDNAKKAYYDALNEVSVELSKLKETGTRHLSAFHLCDEHDGTSCYVVSQDGDATLFWSDKSTVYRWRPLWPYSSQSDHS